MLTKARAKSSIAGSAFKGLRHRQNIEDKKILRCVVLYAGRELLPFSEKLRAVLLSV